MENLIISFYTTFKAELDKIKLKDSVLNDNFHESEKDSWDFDEKKAVEFAKKYVEEHSKVEV